MTASPENKSVPAVCERCGTALSRDAAEGLCPRCLLETVVNLSPKLAGSPRAAESRSGDAPESAGSFLPRTFGDFQLIKRIGQGGMGIVYKAQQISLGRTVALKMLPFGAFTQDDFVKRFHTEAQAAAKLQHPNIVSIFEVGEREGQHFFSMEFVDGPNLAEVVGNQPMPEARAVRMTRSIAEAVQFAHEHGILHRDLKPSNILVDLLDQPKVTDFGLAKDLAGDSELTMTGQALGSPSYIPPEQAEGRRSELGPRSDVYSLGAILYHLLTGRPPFAGESITATVQQVINDEPVTPRLLNPAVSQDLEVICLKCLEKEPARRYASARELADELGRFQNDEPIRARPVSVAEKLWRWCRRRPALAGALGAAVTFLVAGLIVSLWQWRRAENHARELSATVTRLKLDQAEERLASGGTSEGLALLAALLRADPANRVAAQRVVSVLQQRDFLRPLPGQAETWHVRWLCGFAQHGDLLITTGADGRTLSLWDTSDGFTLKRTIPVGEPIRRTAFSGDGKLVAVATHEKSLRLYDLADGRLLAGPYPLDGLVEQLDLDAEAAHAVVVTASDDSLANWRSLKGAMIRLADGRRLHEGIRFHHAAFSPDGRLVVTVNGGAAQVRDAQTLSPTGTVLQEPYRINMAQWSPDSRRVITAGANFNATIWNAATGQPELRLPHAVNVQAAWFSPEGSRVCTQDNANLGRFWDVTTGRMVGNPFPQEKGHGESSFSPDGRRFLSYSRSTAELRDVETSLPLAESLPVANVPTRARFLPDGRRFVLITMDGATRLWDTTPRGFAPKIFHERLELADGRLSPDGKLAALAVKANSFRILDTSTTEPIVPELLHDYRDLRTVRWSPDSTRLVTASVNGTARIWEARSGQTTGEPLQHTGPLTYAEFSSDGRWVATASEDGTARIWSATNGQPASSPLKHSGVVRRARFSPDGNLLVTASVDRTVRFWSVPQGQEIGAALTNELDFHDAVFSPDSHRVGTVGQASYAQLWNVGTRRAITPPLRHAGYVSSIRFSPSGRHVVTASSDGTARVWNALTGQPVSRPLRHREEVTVAEFSPDGRFVLTASIDGTARLWDAATGHSVSDPFRHDQRIVAGEWARDGSGFFTVSYDRTAKRWPCFLVPEGKSPRWLASLAEAKGLLRNEGEEIFRHVPMDQVLAAHESLGALESADAEDGRKWRDWVQPLLTPPVPVQASRASP